MPARWTPINEIAPTDDDPDLFRRAMGDVRPVPSNRAPAEVLMPPKPGPAPVQPADPIPQTSPRHPPLQPGDVMIYRASGVQERVLKRLRQGHSRWEAELDLHGLTVAVAQPALDTFIESAYADGLRHLLIIHGKGYRSEGGEPILKNLVNDGLTRNPRILAFCSARPEDGGTGALYVLIRQNPEIVDARRRRQNLAD